VAARFAAGQHFKVDRAAVKRWLAAHNDKDVQEESSRDLGGYQEFRFEIVPIAKINVPPMWNAGRPGPLRTRMQQGLALDPIRLHESGGRYEIDDGIHRTNVSKEFGYTHMPAILERWVETPELRTQDPPEKPQLALGDWVKLHKPEGGLVFGYVAEKLGARIWKDVKRWMYGIALVDERSTWPDFVDLKDTEFEPVKPPVWGASVQKRVQK
jgi:hypothetical protein